MLTWGSDNPGYAQRRSRDFTLWDEVRASDLSYRRTIYKGGKMIQVTWKLEEFEPKTVSPERWARFHEYRNLIHQEVRPNDPNWPNDLVEEQLKIDTPFRRQWRYEVLE